MPMPWSYRHATKDWQAFLADAREGLELDSDNMTYTAVQGVLIAFRRRLTPEQVAAFAQVLPAVLRAIFIDGWDPAEPPVPFARRDVLDAEVRAHRRHHNLTPPAPIAPVARALRRALDQRALDHVLAQFPAAAAEFWAVEPGDPSDLARRIV